MSKRTEIASEIADKIINNVSAHLYGESLTLYDDLRNLVANEEKSAVIALNPKIKVLMDTEGVIDIEVKLEWNTQVKRSTEVTSSRIDPDQVDMFEGIEVV